MGAALSIVVTPLCGHLSDKVGQRRLFLCGLCILALYCYPFFIMLNSANPYLIWLAFFLAVGVVFPIMYAPESMLFARQFPAEIRYSGISISVQFAGVLGGGLAPLIATKLLSLNQGQPTWVIIYIVTMAIIAIICTLYMKSDRYYQQHISKLTAEVESPPLKS